jgi:hypothetical protein
MKNNFLKLLSLICICEIAHAQSELGLYNFNNIHQSSFLNVANTSEYKFSMGLPGIGSISSSVGNSGFSLAKDLIDTASANRDTAWTKGSFVDKMAKKNITYMLTSVDLISFRVKARNSYFSFNITDHAEFRTMLPKDLFGVVVNGNAGNYIGNDIVLSNIRLDAQYYREYGVGYQHETKKKWSYGFRVKLLQGLANVHTSKSTTTIHVGKDEVEGNEHNVKSDMVVNTSYNKEWENLDINFDDPNSVKKMSKLFFSDFSNLGLGLDFGASYKLNKRLTFSGSLNNLGFIRWKENTKNYKFKGETVIKGVESKNVSDFNGENFNFQRVVDSIGNAFKLDTTGVKYTSNMVGSSTITANYKLWRNTELNALFNASFYKGSKFSASVGIHHNVAKWFSIMAYWSARYNQYNNLGLGFMVKPGPVQLYAICDNLTPFFSANEGGETDFYKTDFKHSNIRFGMNIAIGRVKGPEAQTFSDK